MKIMTSCPITSWQLDGETMETVRDFILGLKNHCSHEIKKTLAPWKKSYDQPRWHIKKQRHYLLTKVHLVKAMVFLVVMYGCESWTLKKALLPVLSLSFMSDSLQQHGLQPARFLCPWGFSRII